MVSRNELMTACILSACIVSATQRGSAPARCEFNVVKDKGIIHGLTSLNASDLYYKAGKTYYECLWKIYVSQNQVKIQFKDFRFNGQWPDCAEGANITIYDYARQIGKVIYNETYCGEKRPPPFFSAGKEVDVVVRGNLEKFILTHDVKWMGQFTMSYKVTKKTPGRKPECGPCGGNYLADRGRIYSPSFPNNYSSNCQCLWEISLGEGYTIKFHYISFDLERKQEGKCYDRAEIYDGAALSAPVLSSHCGQTIPTDVKTSGSKALVRFISDFSDEQKGFDLYYESVKEERDLTGLRSIAAILGGVSFGIFVFLLLCSVLYKRYVGDQQSPTSCGEHCDDHPDDYVDAVQAGAPPSYQIVMAAPDMYPRTPEISPAGTPDGSPNSSPTPSRRARTPRLRHTGNGVYVAPSSSLSVSRDANLPLTPPPPYSAIVRDNQVSFEEFPPPPSYDILGGGVASEGTQCEDREGLRESHLLDEDSAALLPREEVEATCASRPDASHVKPLIGRLSLSNAVTNWRSREGPCARSNEHRGNGTGGSGSRRFSGSRSLSNFFHSGLSKTLRREPSASGVWSQRRSPQEPSRFAASLAMSLSSLKRKYEDDRTENGQCVNREDVQSEEQGDNPDGLQRQHMDEAEDDISELETEDDSMIPSSSFDRFSLSRHRRAQDCTGADHSDLRSLCSESGSMHSIVSTQSDSSRQYLVNLSGHDKSKARPPRHGRVFVNGRRFVKGSDIST